MIQSSTGILSKLGSGQQSSTDNLGQSGQNFLNPNTSPIKTPVASTAPIAQDNGMSNNVNIRQPEMPQIQQPNLQKVFQPQMPAPQPIQQQMPAPQQSQPISPSPQNLINQPWIGGGQSGQTWDKIGSPLAQDPSLAQKGNNDPNLVRNQLNNWGFF